MRTSIGVAAVLLAALAGCTDADSGSGTNASPGTPSATPIPPALTREVSGCQVTLPQPVSTSESWAPGLFGAGNAVGDGRLWAGGLGDGGVIVAAPEFVQPDGSIHWKLGWWRRVAGTLTITGRRLDAAAPPLRANVPSGYGDSGFQASGVYFPQPGCWEITGAVGSANLTFVTLVTTTTG